MNKQYPFINPPLPYAYDALEPHIDSKTMHLHHDRHLQTYVNNLNKTLENYPELQNLSLTQLLYNIESFPKDAQRPIRNNAGGVYNHVFYFNGMSSSDDRLFAGELYDAIQRHYGSFEKFYEQFKEAALSVFGSGYAWLVADKDGKLKIITTANQDTPIPLNLYPILTIDVWEHAYYLKHYNERAAYIDDWFQVVDWAQANMIFETIQNDFWANSMLGHA